MQRPLVLLAAATLVVVALCVSARGARAAAEFCPARLVSADAGEGAQAYRYSLEAFTPRAVDATIVADTDAGWYTWDVKSVALAPLKLRRAARGVTYTIPISASAPLVATFPSSVRVRHAWVTRASAIGETFFGWDAQGTTVCAVPSFDDADSLDPLQMDAAQLSPASHAGVTTQARSTNEPFAPTSCARPFKPTTSVSGKAPEFPIGVRAWFTGTAAAALAVAVDASDRAVDSWVLAGTGVPDLDKASLAAANGSTYESGISYCRPAPGYFLYFSTFTTTS